MSREARFKLVIIGITLLACAAGLAGADRLRAWPPWRRSPPPREPEPPRAEPGAVGTGLLDEAAVRELLPHLATATWVRYDPTTVVRVVPDQALEVRWPEHAGGVMTLRTNPQGFREDQPTAARAVGPRVLVLGDSHTFGLVENHESFANLLEQALGAGRDEPLEVINAGVSGTGPFESRALLGVLLAELQPDVVLFVLYTGNDFLNTQAFADFEARRPRNPVPRPAQLRFSSARDKERERMAQNISQLHSFIYRRGDAEVALQATLQCLREMAHYCDTFDARFLVAILPTKEDVDTGDLEHMQVVRDELMLCAEDFALVRQLARRCELALLQSGIPVVDLLPQLTGRPMPLYWKLDHHLNVAGHRAVTMALLDPLRQMLNADKGR